MLAPSTAHVYRPDIDGLRALAVLAVILFHANLYFPGGFIGVDVFFVISGYLITQIVNRELSEGRFSLLVFYQRRMRRIFPALFVMFAVATLIGYFTLPAQELKDLGESLTASAGFYSNILFYNRSGYFAPQAEFQPLLHTWTLSVEEQFYLGWPLLLLVLSLPTVPWLSKFKLPVSITILIGSLLLSAQWVVPTKKAAFFLLPPRAWELALGALLSFPVASSALTKLPRHFASICSLTGIGMLAIAATTYGEKTLFPGFSALLPCGGAALIIAAGIGGSSIGGKILSLQPLVWIGLISYSLYIWHWPIFFFGRLAVNHKLDRSQSCALVALTFLVGWLSWRFVERPFRNTVVRSDSRIWVIGGLGLSALFAAIGAVLYFQNGFPNRKPEIVDWLNQQSKETLAFQSSPCMAREDQIPLTEGCLLGAPSADSRYQVVLWGDSHAAQLAPGFQQIGQKLGATTRLITKPGCPPILSLKYLPFHDIRAGCPAFNDAALNAILQDKNIRVVVLSSTWGAFTGKGLLLTTDGKPTSQQETRNLFVSSMRKLFAVLTENGRQVIVIGQVPVPPLDFVNCVTRARFTGRDENACASEPTRDRMESLMNLELQEAALHMESSVQLVNPYDSFCTSKGCIVQSDGQLLYMDNQHLSHNGVRLLESSLLKSLQSALLKSKN